MAGNFTASELLDIKLKAELMWSGSQASTDFIPQAQSAIAVLNNQTATFTELENHDKDRTVIVNWVKACDLEIEDCVSNCDLTEPELDTAGKEYALDTCKKTGFSIDEETLRTNTYSLTEIAARGMAKCLRNLDEFWAQRMLAKLHAFTGVNVAPTPYPFNPATAQTTIPAADYNRNLAAYFIKEGIQNKIRDMYFIDNGELFIDFTNADFDASNQNGKGDQSRVRALKLYFDMFNFGGAGVDDTTFLIGQNAVAMTTRTRHTSTPTLIGGSVQQTLYTVKSPSLPGVFYDVYYTVKCTTVNGKAHFVDTWRIETQGLIALNPEACPVVIDVEGVPTSFSPTGVLAFKKGA